KARSMFKYFTLIICLPFVATAQQSNAVYYAAPYLQIEKVDEKTTADANDFGYNILIHPESSFIKEAFYMWVDDQWYEILNSKDIFTTTNEVSTLFTISKNS